MTLAMLYERASQQGIEIDEVHMRELRAVSFPEGWIAMDRAKFDSDTEYKCELAHEIGHCETGSFYNIYSPYDLKEKCERKANKRAVEILMPFDMLQDAMAHGYNDVDALAEYFDVTTEFAAMALDIYAGRLIEASEKRQMAHVLARVGIGMSKQKLPPVMTARQLMMKGAGA